MATSRPTPSQARLGSVDTELTTVYLGLLSPVSLQELVALQAQVNAMVQLIRSHHPKGPKKEQDLRWQRLQLLEYQKLSLLWQLCKGNLKALNLLSQHVAKLAQ